MNEHDEFWEPTRKFWKAVKRFTLYLPNFIKRWTPVLLFLVLVVELINVAGTLGGSHITAARLYAHTALAAGACIGLGLSK